MIRTKRNKREQAFYLGSGILIAVPLFYWSFLEPEYVWPMLCALGLQSVLTTVLRFRKVKVYLQLWSLIPTALASFVAGLALLAWPFSNIGAVPSKELQILAVLVAFSTVSNGLAIFSFPTEKD